MQHRIVALGSNIRNDDDHPTHTNLFQKHLPQTDFPIHVNRHRVSDFSIDHNLSPGNTNWLIDTQNTGYLIPPSQSVHFARQHQKSRDHKNEEDTAGDFATAWIDHGMAPDNADYEYLIVVDTTPDDMRRLARAAANGSGNTYEVLQKDDHAHMGSQNGVFNFFNKPIIDSSPSRII